jgi:hypothetical protein
MLPKKINAELMSYCTASVKNEKSRWLNELMENSMKL